MKLTLGNLRSLIVETAQKPVKVRNLPPVLYHVTSRANVKSIKKGGLQPRASARLGYEPRIYLASDEQVAVNMFEWLQHPGVAELFKVTLSALPPNTKFYDDLDAGKGCYWTPDPIPPVALEQVPLDD
jgi:hypothetical protein